MSENEPHRPAASASGSAGGLEARAKAIAQRRAALRAAHGAEQEPPLEVSRSAEYDTSRLPAPEAAAPASHTHANPFLPDPPQAAPASLVDEGTEERESGLAALGFGHTPGPVDPPLAPAPLNPAVLIPTRLPAGPGPRGVIVQLVDLHGGAGSSTLASLLGPQALDCGTSLSAIGSTDLPVLFVTRSHARGLDLALRLGQQYAARSLDPLTVVGIVVVYDAPTLSRGLSRTLKSVQKALPNCWVMPWSEDLRHMVTPPDVASHGRLARAVRSVLSTAAELRESRESPDEHHRYHG